MNSIFRFRKFNPYVWVILFFFINISYAVAASGYKLLAPIPTITNPDGTPKTTDITLVDYMKGVFVATIGLAIILAVVQLIIGGIEYVAAAVPSAKEDAKRRIGGAVGGLLLILAAWIILQELNPKLLNVGLNLENVALFNEINSGTGGGPTSAGGGDTGGASCPDADTLKTSLASGGTVCGGSGSCHSLCNTSPWDASIKKYSSVYGVPEDMIRATIRHESSCNPSAGSVDGKSCGLMQVVGGCSLDPDTNISQGTQKLASAIKNANSVKDQYGSTVSFNELVYNAYNGGGKDNQPSVSCKTADGWPTIPKWGCPLSPGTGKFNACFERLVACGFDKCFSGL